MTKMKKCEGPKYFTYNGKILSDLRHEIESQETEEE